jgi:hypothetical protein
MKHAVPASLKWAYVVCVLTAVIPFGLSRSGWVALATGSGIMGGVPLAGLLVLLVVAIYRSYLVATVPGTLESCHVVGFPLALRKIGIVGLYVGAVIGLLDVVGGPLLMLLMAGGLPAGPVFFVAGVALAVVGRIGVLALGLFELSRLVGFEQQRRSQPELADTVIQR